jgi:hypothetical protein
MLLVFVCFQYFLKEYRNNNFLQVLYSNAISESQWLFYTEHLMSKIYSLSGLNRGIFKFSYFWLCTNRYCVYPVKRRTAVMFLMYYLTVARGSHYRSCHLQLGQPCWMCVSNTYLVAQILMISIWFSSALPMTYLVKSGTNIYATGDVNTLRSRFGNPSDFVPVVSICAFSTVF